VKKNHTNRLTDHSENLSFNYSLKTQSSSTVYRWRQALKTALFTVSKGKYHLTNPDFDHLLLHTSYEVSCFLFFKRYDFYVILKTRPKSSHFPLNCHSPRLYIPSQTQWDKARINLHHYTNLNGVMLMYI